MPYAMNRHPGDMVDWSRWWPWLPIGAGFLILYIPSYISFWGGIWQTEEHGHGPLILAVVIWMFWQQRDALINGTDRPRPLPGFISLAFGLLCYIVGRSQDVLILEVGSHIPVLIGALLVARGWGAVRALWFPILFIVFMVPLPGPIVDALTNPLKRHVSEIAEHLLYGAGYPIARSGVTLTIGPYQLLVADACSGLHSLYSLSALGLLYLYLMKHTSWIRNGVLMALLLPIAFGANVVRVIFLVLVTYHLGDEAGQGFLHGFAGMVLFVAALLLIFLIDALLGIFLKDRRATA